MTTLKITLSATLQTQLDKAGVWAYAVYFNASGAPIFTDLVNNGTIENGGTNSIALPSPFNSGKVYLLVQSQAATDPNDLPTLITKQSDISFGNATTYDYSYDSYEVTLNNSTNDQSNLTSVNGFSLPMEVSVAYSNGTTATVGYKVSAASIVSAIEGANPNPSADYTYTYTSGPLAGQFRTAVAPTESVTPDTPVAHPPYQASDWSGYVNALIAALKSTTPPDILISGQFNGAKDADNIWHNGGYYAYQLQYDTSDGDLWLVPLAQSQIKGYIQITPANLENSIYSTLGTVNVYTNMTDATPYPGAANMNTGLNNQWGAVLAQFLTGFTGGYYGQSGVSLNPQVTTPINLDQNNNWDPTYAFHQHVSTPAPTYQSYDPYSQVFFADSNSYGSGYSDALMQQYSEGGPLLSVSQPNTVPGVNVPEIDLTVFANGETPTGYTTPVIYNDIAAPSGGYAIPNTSGSVCNVDLVFNSNPQFNAGIVPASTDTVILKVLLSDTGDVPVWSTVTIDGSSPAAGAYGLWQVWDISFANGQFVATPQSTPQSKPAGDLLIAGLPTATSGVSWYQIQIGANAVSAATAKTYNLYVTTSGGQFLNPNYGGQASALAVDGLAKITPQNPAGTPPATITAFTVNFAPSTTVSYDPSLAEADTANFGVVTPSAPVAGQITNGAFHALADQNALVSNTITTTIRNVAFGWTGDNNAVGTPSWISGYTNLTNGQDVARITIKPQGAGPTQYLTATADIAGKWQTGTLQLALGEYTITMQEFLPSDTTFRDPLTNVSGALVLDEVPTSGVLPCFVAGTRIRTACGDMPVEQLSVGATLVTAAGRGEATVIWLGHRTVDCNRHSRPETVLPIRICRDAFGAGLPERDILLSPDHAVFVDDVLIPVQCLVNETTVRREPAGVVTYHHVELERHDVILADGLPVESFLDTGNRAAFVNGGPVVQVHPAFAQWAWEAAGCAPLVVAGPALERVRARLDRAAPAPPCQPDAGAYACEQRQALAMNA